MRLKTVLTAAAIYLAILGLGFMLIPERIGMGAVPENPSAALVAYLRIFGGPCLGIAVLNWMARDSEPSRALDGVILGNIVGFGGVALMDVWGVFGGGGRPLMKMFLVIHLLMTIAFIVAGKARMRPREVRLSTGAMR